MERMTNRAIERNGVLYFKCRKCGEVKPLNKCYFHINTIFSTGFNSKCKSCVNEERESKPKVKYITRAELEKENKKLKSDYDRLDKVASENVRTLDELEAERIELEEENKKLKERIDVLYEFIERNDKLVDEVIAEEDLDKLNWYIYIDDDLVDRTLENGEKSDGGTNKRA